MISVCATGDSMLLKLFPNGYPWENIANLITACDVRITNLEEVLSDWDCCASTYCGGQWVNAPRDRLLELLKFGFNLFSCANNHAMDYSYDGIASTMDTLRKARLPFAGIGDSLDAASRAGVLQLSGGRTVALISITSTFIDAARAGNSKGPIPARPGVNPLRVKTSYHVNSAHMQALRAIALNTHINGERDNARAIGSLPPEPENSLNFGGHFFTLSPDGSEGKSTSCDQRDLVRILAEVTSARNVADLVLVSIHSHQIRQTSYCEPDLFLEEFAHACIDAGAHAVIGGGTHQLKPIEIYNGKPIFYSLGNFVFQLNLIEALPDDYWDKYGFSRDIELVAAQARKTHNGKIGLETVEDNYLTILPRMIFNDSGMLVKLELLPLELGFHHEREYKGLPFSASAHTAQYIFERLATMSGAYGTQLSFDGEAVSVALKG